MNKFLLYRKSLMEHPHKAEEAMQDAIAAQNWANVGTGGEGGSKTNPGKEIGQDAWAQKCRLMNNKRVFHSQELNRPGLCSTKVDPWQPNGCSQSNWMKKWVLSWLNSDAAPVGCVYSLVFRLCCLLTSNRCPFDSLQVDWNYPDELNLLLSPLKTDLNH